MAILTDIASKIKNTRLIPPTEGELSAAKEDNHGSKPSESQKRQRPILEITSYDRFTPPSPKPDLEYDCRMTENPSRQIRKTCTGLDSILQDELMHRDSFSDVVTRAEDDIRRLMEVKDVRASREDEVAIVRVGCLCGSGHHRSVAFAEQLGKVKWCEDDEWEIKVVHRDLTDGVEEMKRVRSEQSQQDEREKQTNGGKANH
jgi:RNase adaptor protein for sRNA GlmZ degradation